MKRIALIILTVALAIVGLLAFATPSTNSNPAPTNNYKEMWKKVKENLEKDLPESAEKELDAIEQRASKDKNQTQLLRTWLYLQNIMRFTVEEDPQ